VIRYHFGLVRRSARSGADGQNSPTARSNAPAVGNERFEMRTERFVWEMKGLNAGSERSMWEIATFDNRNHSVRKSHCGL
jgi:hypothetical protein